MDSKLIFRVLVILVLTISASEGLSCYHNIGPEPEFGEIKECSCDHKTADGSWYSKGSCSGRNPSKQPFNGCEKSYDGHGKTRRGCSKYFSKDFCGEYNNCICGTANCNSSHKLAPAGNSHFVLMILVNILVFMFST